jgi:hypothetical protein
MENSSMTRTVKNHGHTIRKTVVEGRYEVVGHSNISIAKRMWETAPDLLGAWFVIAEARSALSSRVERRFHTLRDARVFVDEIINGKSWR